MVNKVRSFAVFDIDGTLIRWQLYHAVSDRLFKHGLIDQATFDNIRGARAAWKRRESGASFKSYESEVIQAYEQALANISRPELLAAVDEVFDEYKDQVYVYTRDLIADLKKSGYLLFAISGSQSEIIEKVASHHGFDAFVGTEYEYRQGKYTGKKTFHAKRKDTALKKLVKQFKASWTKSIAVGDSQSDIAMLELVQKPIAFNPERELFEYARAKKWPIVIERKNVVYKLEAESGAYVLA